MSPKPMIAADDAVRMQLQQALDATNGALNIHLRDCWTCSRAGKNYFKRCAPGREMTKSANAAKLAIEALPVPETGGQDELFDPTELLRKVLGAVEIPDSASEMRTRSRDADKRGIHQ